MEAKFIHFRATVITLTKNSNGFWQDDFGTIYAYADSSTSVDNKPQCGVGMATLPDWPIFKVINDICGLHDYKYESPVYQAFHTRAEADVALQNDLASQGYPVLGEAFALIAERLGAPLWENLSTRSEDGAVQTTRSILPE